MHFLALGAQLARFARLRLAALDAAGWALVPKVPTEAMAFAGLDALLEDMMVVDMVRVYRAMLAAAGPPADIPASGPQTASLRKKPGFGR